MRRIPDNRLSVTGLCRDVEMYSKMGDMRMCACVFIHIEAVNVLLKYQGM